MNRILFIGGHGMLGRPIVRRLINEGFEIRSMARDRTRAGRLLPPKVEIVEGDLKIVDSI